jgi:hypothetical protein
MWADVSTGKTIGTCGSENGIVLRDEEHANGARITLERDCGFAPFAIICGIYGWMFHTRYLSTAPEAQMAFDAMRAQLGTIMTLLYLDCEMAVDGKDQQIIKAIHDFVAEFP